MPEDTHVPLAVLGMVFHACDDQTAAAAESTQKPLSRMKIRSYLKVLIDRSLVLGTVDRPQLHDVMLDYVQKELSGEAYTAAQRQFVELLRKADRSSSTPTGIYFQQNVPHHIKESYEASWERGEQAVSWLEDHVNGLQDVLAASAASLLPVEALAKEAEAAERWWQAALRWSALGLLKRSQSGDLSHSSANFKQAVGASEKVQISGDFTGDSATQFDLDSFELSAYSIIMKEWNPAYLAEFGAQYQKVAESPAGLARPLQRYSALLTLVWFPACLGGSQQAFAAADWKLSKLVLDVCNAESDVYAQAKDEYREEAQVFLKPVVGWSLYTAGEAITKCDGFSWSAFGVNGDFLVECKDAYKFDTHHEFYNELLSLDFVITCGASSWLLTLQFGRVADSIKALDDVLHLTKQVADSPHSPGYMMNTIFGSVMPPSMMHLHGLRGHVQKYYDTLGLTFDNCEETLDTRVLPMQGANFTSLDHKGPGGGLVSLKRCVWHVKCMMILNEVGVPDAKAIAFLDALPEDDEYIAYSMTMPTYDYTSFFNCTQTCYIALAQEKVGLFEGAIRFANLQVEQDMMKGGMPLTKWPRVVAFACKGRALAKLDRHTEALIAFETAIAVSKESFPVIEALAYRELANYAQGGDAAVQAAKDLETKLSTFESQITPAEFAALKISP